MRCLTEMLDAAVEIPENSGVRLWICLPKQQEEGHGCAQGQYHETQRRALLEGWSALSPLACEWSSRLQDVFCGTNLLQLCPSSVLLPQVPTWLSVPAGVQKSCTEVSLHQGTFLSPNTPVQVLHDPCIGDG